MTLRRFLAPVLACALAAIARAEPPPPTECDAGPGWTFIVVDSGRTIATMPASLPDILHVRDGCNADDSLRLGMQSCCCSGGDEFTPCSSPIWNACPTLDCGPEDGLALGGCITQRSDGRAHVPIDVTVWSRSGQGQVFVGAVDEARLDHVVGNVVVAPEGVTVTTSGLDLLVGRTYHVQATLLRSVDPNAPPSGLHYVGETENYRLVVTAAGSSLIAALTPDGQIRPSSSSATCSTAGSSP